MKTPLTTRLLALALLLGAASPALGQSFTGPASITQPTTAGNCVKVGPNGGNVVVDAGAPCGSGSGTVTSVSGTANQINVATGTTTPVLSLSSTLVAPGTVGVTTSLSIGAGSAITSSGAGGALGTAAFSTIGTSGNTVPKNNTANVFSAAQGINLNAAALPTAQTGTQLQIANLDAVAPRIELDPYGTSGFFTSVRRSGTAALPTQVLAGEQIGGFNAMALDNAATIRGPIASFRTYAGEAITSTNMGSIACLATIPLTTATLADQACMYGSTGLLIGGAAATTVPAAKLHVVSTTEALRLAYDGSNYGTFTINSSGSMTLGAIADVRLNAGSGNSNLFQVSGTTIFSLSSTTFNSSTSCGPRLTRAAGSATVPNIIPCNSATTNGFAADASNLWGIVGGATIETLSSAGAAYTGVVTATAGFGVGTSPSATIPFNSTTSTNGGVSGIAANSSSGTGANTRWGVQNNGGTSNDRVDLRVNSSGFTTAYPFVQDGGGVICGSGLSGGCIIATQADAPISFGTGATTAERGQITSTGYQGAIGQTTPAAGTFTAAVATSFGLASAYATYGFGNYKSGSTAACYWSGNSNTGASQDNGFCAGVKSTGKGWITGGNGVTGIDFDYSPGTTIFNIDTNGLNVNSGKRLQLGNAYAGGATVPTGSLILYDSAGAAYKVPACLASGC